MADQRARDAPLCRRILRRLVQRRVERFTGGPARRIILFPGPANQLRTYAEPKLREQVTARLVDGQRPSGIVGFQPRNYHIDVLRARRVPGEPCTGTRLAAPDACLGKYPVELAPAADQGPVAGMFAPPGGDLLPFVLPPFLLLGEAQHVR